MRSNDSNVSVVTLPNASRSSIVRGRLSRKPMRTRSTPASGDRGRGVDELEAVARAGVGDVEVALERVVAGEQRRRARAQRRVLLAHDHLVEIAVVDPELRAVADDQLLERLLVRPAEPARALRK